MITDLTKWFHQVDVLQLILGFGLMLLTYALMRAQKNEPSFNLRDLMVGPDGHVSMTKFAQLGSFLVSSWGFVHFVAYNQLSDWYFTAYMVSWGGSPVLAEYLKNKANPPAPKDP